jgi:hypothetical protein
LFRKFRIIPKSFAIGITATAISVAGILPVSSSAQAQGAAIFCNQPYISGHSTYMSCSGYGFAAVTIRCSSFGYWLGRRDFPLTRTKDIYGSGVVENSCGWNSWPAEIKGFSFV